jgi:PAS domain S-box-containing protein
MQLNQDHPQALLRQSEDRFSLLFRKSPVSTSITSIDTGRFLAVNDAWSAMFGYSADEVAARTSFELDLWVSSDNRCELLRLVRANGSAELLPARLRRRSGQIFDAVISAETIDLNGGQYLLTLVQDVMQSPLARTALKQTEERFHELAHGASHDFNNLLAMILGCAELISLQTGADPKIQKYVDRIIDAAQRGKSVTRRLTAFSQSESSERPQSGAADADFCTPATAASVETDRA